MKVYTIIGFAIGLLWFVLFQFYWPPTPELTDLVFIIFFWPCVALFVILMVLGARNTFFEQYGAPHVAIGFVFSLLWFILLQFYWPPTVELTDTIDSAFFWPSVVLLTYLMAVGFTRLYREVRYYRLKRKSHSEKFAKLMYIALRRNADLSDTDFDIYSLEEVQDALKVAFSGTRR